MRLFYAIELPATVRDDLARHVAALRAAEGGSEVRWERAEKMHVTVRFVGEVEPERVPCLEEACALAAADVTSSEVTVEEAGTFPARGTPRVWWLGVSDATGGMARLHARLAAELARCGFAPETRPFRPHVTVGRSKRFPRALEPLADAHRTIDFTAQTFDVRELVLVRSELGAGGSRYTTVARCELKK